MARATKRLGRGLDSLVSNLIGQVDRETATDPTAPATPNNQPPARPTYKGSPSQESPPPDRSPTAHKEPTGAGSTSGAEIPIDLLSPNPYQPRRNIDPQDLQELADSLRINGMINPITVRRSRGGFQIIAGERRWQAAGLAGLDTVPVSIKDADDRQMHELALVENIQREDLNAIDRASAYQDYCKRYRASADDVARRLGENRTTVTNYLRLLDLPERVQQMVADGHLTMGHARCLVGLPEREERIQFAEEVLARALSVRALEEMVRQAKNPSFTETRGKQPPKAGDPKPKSAHIQDLEERFATALATRVQIQEGRNRDTGRIVIEYYSLSDFDRLASTMGIDLDT